MIWLLLIPIVAQANYGEAVLNESTWVTLQADQNVDSCRFWADDKDTLSGWAKSGIAMIGSATTWGYKTTFASSGNWLIKIKYYAVADTHVHFVMGTYQIRADIDSSGWYWFNKIIQIYTYLRDTTFSISDTNSFGSNTFSAIKAKTDKMRYHSASPNDTDLVSYSNNASGTAPTVAEIATGVFHYPLDTTANSVGAGSYVHQAWDKVNTNLDATVGSRFARVGSDSLATVMSRIYSYLTTTPFSRSGSDSLATVMSRVYSYLTATPFSRSGSDSLAGVMSRLYSYLNATPGNFSRTGSDSLATVMSRIYSYLTASPSTFNPATTPVTPTDTMASGDSVGTGSGGSGADTALIMAALRAGGNITFVGTYACTLLVLDDSDDPVAGAKVLIYPNTTTSTPTTQGQTNANGKVFFTLDTLTSYYVRVGEALYSQDNTYDTFTVLTSHLYDTVRMTAYVIPVPTDPRQVTLWLCFKDFGLDERSGAKITCKLNNSGIVQYADTMSFVDPSEKNFIVASNGIGYVTVIRSSEMIPTNLKYKIIIPLKIGGSWTIELLAPDVAIYRIRK